VGTKPEIKRVEALALPVLVKRIQIGPHVVEVVGIGRILFLPPQAWIGWRRLQVFRIVFVLVVHAVEPFFVPSSQRDELVGLDFVEQSALCVRYLIHS